MTTFKATDCIAKFTRPPLNCKNYYRNYYYYYCCCCYYYYHHYVY